MRPIAAPFVVAAPTGARIRTRLRPTAADDEALRAMGEHLGHLASTDLAARVRLGAVAGLAAQRAQRKQALTAPASSRWAGSITRASDDQYRLSVRVLRADVVSLRATIGVIERRLAAPVGDAGVVGHGRVKGYLSRGERWSKQRRLDILRTRLDAGERALESGCPSVVRGGRRLANARHHLAEASLSLPQRRSRWEAARWFLAADGGSGKRYGNQTISVSPDGMVKVKMPGALTARYGTHLTMLVPVAFSHRGAQWLDRVATNRAVRYDITFDAGRDRWYLDASWGAEARPTPALADLTAGPVLGVDLNADHLAAWVVDASGNPTGPAIRIETDLAGPTSQRDGRLRAAISVLIAHARAGGCQAVVIEDLNFADARATGRERMGRGRRGKRFRRTVAGIPTGSFRQRLVGMATNAGLHVVAVDPAYTSRWGAQHWQKPLAARQPAPATTHASPAPTALGTTTSSSTVSRHAAAAVVIGRRAQGHQARRRIEALPGASGDPGRDQRISRRESAATQAAPRTVPRQGERALPHPSRRPPGRKTDTGSDRQRAAHAPKTVRGASTAAPPGAAT